MRKVKQFRKWVICQLNEREVMQYGFRYAVIHPDNVQYLYMCNPSDTDIQCDSLEQATSWTQNY